MRRRLSTLLDKYEPRLLSRSTTILKPSSKTCCSIVSRTFDDAIVPRLRDFSLFAVRFRDGTASVSTGGILIIDRNLWRERGQWVAHASRVLVAVSRCNNLLRAAARWWRL